MSFTGLYTHDEGFTKILAVKRFSPDAIVPKRQTEGAIGHDLHSIEEAVIPPHSLKLIDTGIGVQLPYGTYARVAPRSGLSVKGIDTMAGVVDADWTNSIKVVLFNHMDTEYKVEKGERVAQLILEMAVMPVVWEVEDLRPTQRGGGGFGHTGRF